MAAKTAIAWTDHTFNIAWGCVKVSPGCKFCYADDLARRYGQRVWGPGQPRRTFFAAHWGEPLKWDAQAAARGRPALVFSSSMCDVFEDHPTIAAERARLWPLIEATPNLLWQLLTKRPERIAAALPANWPAIRDRVWLGTSIENNDYVWRADHLRPLDAAVRFVSYEPALGPLDGLDLTGLGWLIYGGESGPHFRPEDKQWARDVRRRCAAAGIPFFHKQSATRFTERGIALDGAIVREFPAAARRGTDRNFPSVAVDPAAASV